MAERALPFAFPLPSFESCPSSIGHDTPAQLGRSTVISARADRLRRAALGAAPERRPGIDARRRCATAQQVYCDEHRERFATRRRSRNWRGVR